MVGLGGQLRSKSSANRSSLLTGPTAAGGSSSCVVDWDGKASAVEGWTVYCLPSPKSMTSPKKLSSSSSI